MAKVSIIIPAYNVGNFLEHMLSSIKKQTFDDFEALIINDGSVDNTAEIAETYCMEDSRFRLYSQDNQGVSAARNKGIELAKGTWLAFYDGDDYIPPKALEHMVLTGEARKADLVAGRFRVNRLYENKSTKSTIRLSNKEFISRFDTDLLWTFSVCNKLFRRERLEMPALRFNMEQMITEDGLFLMQFIHRCERICGCPAVAYEYIRRPFWEEASATQHISEERLRNMYQSFKEIEKTVREHTDFEEMDLTGMDGAKRQEICDKLQYRATLYKRFVKSDFLSDYYRNLWESDKDLNFLVKEYVDYCRQEMFPSMWEDVVKKSFGLHLEEGIRTRREAAEKPDVTILLKKELAADSVNQVILSCYRQDLPFFELLADEELQPHIDAKYLKRENFHIIRKNQDLMQQVRGKYAMILSEDILLTGNTLQVMIKSLEEDDTAQCMTVPVMELRKGELSKMKAPRKKKVELRSNMLFKAGFLAYKNPAEIEWCEKETEETFVLKGPFSVKG